MASTYTPVEMIAKLVGFDTVSRNSNLDLIDFVADYLAEYGVSSTKVYNDDGTKANLFATVGPNVEGGIVLSGHTDVVPVDGQPWDTDPFEVVEKDGKLYGRGTADMKSFSAIALSMVPEMLEKGIKKPIHFALSYDEEVGCLGSPRLIEYLAKEAAKPRAVIVGEPTMMDIVTAHKGIVGLRTKVTGREAHSSLVEDGVSAVMTATRLVNFIADMMAENKAKMDPDNPYAPAPGYTTLHVGVINGGTAMNIISRECEFLWDIRYIAEDDPQDFIDRFNRYVEEEILPAMKAVAPEADIVTEIRSSTPALGQEEDGEAEMLCKSLTGKNNTSSVAYAAEAGQFQEAGFSTVICGPGSIGIAHQPNEFIEVDQVRQSEAFIRKLIVKLAG
ncbi:acetylornithine deacetylase [Sneathiella chinensis]|uniref:Acetylornithine deacetylase n=1 Tax=Sneathiella chinensis TaxID=349750 RepID=A0ABQ5U4P4_9PROT|nr:acetylornithine deacetylase [Sneathiella chinensis]GLQ06721.1 acetylornithine deacetylase [Sneathiella chinensis]